jgi:hypothetical protein
MVTAGVVAYLFAMLVAMLGVSDAVAAIANLLKGGKKVKRG